ncbi:RagB/SusD family nutrient uptake outer membrane protein [Chitinophaga sp. SYP-B3965]|uniref:RagB/SusD family nutrient uptake outer membrane protein n=1 Tax=Chitinophaga sp. SYP-B3965 TaxID=2663120 RepID=UPI001299F07F|nr:RagB/SusD family nutrient uptake outer membrane protein [Chitinophaga sp. SYP-B3965]MRG48803.1 RagB/SusD family nutrient uptake outer membrane protein [Chitinophaga sp. SYP-B3965]
MKRYKILIAGTLMLMVAAACNKFVEVPLPITQLNTAAVFADDQKANTAIRGIYASTQYSLGTGPFSGGLTTNLGVASDEFVKLTYGADEQQFFEFKLANTNGVVSGTLWGPMYNIIYQANVLLENVEKSPGVTPRTKDQLLGEGRFLRALNYFYLVNCFDSVPLLLTSDYRVNALAPRSSPEKVWAQIEEDLLFAQEKTGEAYMKEGVRIRANKWTATALLARMYLYRKNWAEAEKQASAVINTGAYKLDSLNGISLLASPEAIWQIAGAGANLYTYEASKLASNATPTTNMPFRLSPSLLAAFEPGDQRRVKWTRTGTDGFPGCFKYKIYSNTQVGAKAEGSFMFRLAEQYLIRAEARAQQDKLTDAIADVDSIRYRAGLPLIKNTNPGISKADLLQAIYKERFTELFGELGHRWFDIKRTGQADAIYSAHKTGWNATNLILPIPLSERQRNPNLSQNPGYE